MGIFDAIKGMLGGEEPKPDVTTSPSQLLRQAGVDPSGLKFAFNNNNISVSGTVSDGADAEKIKAVLSTLDGIDAVSVDVAVAEAPAEPETATVADAAPTAEPEAAGEPATDELRTYVVQSGDTLSKIAEEMYGNGSRYMTIFEANQDLLENPDQIFPGQELKIPELKE